MPIRFTEILQCDLINELAGIPTDTPIPYVACAEDGYLYRKIPNGEGGTIWGRRSTMSTAVYDLNVNGVVDNSERLGGQLPGFYATLNDLTAKADLVGGKVPTSQLPSMPAGIPLGQIASQAAMLALTQNLAGQAIGVGDFGVRTDLNKGVVLTALPASTLGNWVQYDLQTNAVTSVNSQTGNVVLGKGDLGLENVENLAPDDYPVSIAQAQADTDALNAAEDYTDAALQNLSTSNVPEGVNLYFTNNRTDARVAAGITGKVDKTITVNGQPLSGNVSIVIPDAQVNADWNASSGLSQILNKPTLGTAAAQNTGAFATAAQGAKADTAYQSSTAIPQSQVTNLVTDLAAKASIASVNLQNSAVPTWQRIFSGQFATTDATLTPIFTSAVIPDGTSVWVDCTIHAQYNSGQGQAVLSMQGAIQKTAGSNIRLPQAIRLQTTGDLGLAIATCSITLNTSLQKFIVNIQGKAATNLKWSGKIEINTFTMV